MITFTIVYLLEFLSLACKELLDSSSNSKDEESYIVVEDSQILEANKKRMETSIYLSNYFVPMHQ